MATWRWIVGLAALALMPVAGHAALQFDYVFGNTGAGNNQFNVVAAIEFDAQNRFYVLDRGNSRIQVFAPDLSFERTIPVGPDVFDFTLDDAGNVYTTNSQKISKYDALGNFIGWSGQCNDGPNCNSTFLDGDDSNNYSLGFVCTDATCQLDPLFRPDQTTVRVGGLINYSRGFLYSQSGTFLYRAGLDNALLATTMVPGWGGSHSDFEVLESGDSILLDPFNDRAVRVDPAGNLLFEIKGRFPTLRLDIPQSVDVDAEGNILIVDFRNRSVVKFDPLGQYLDRSPFSSATPYALELDRFGNIYYVTRSSINDADDNRVFRMNNPANVIVNSVGDQVDHDLNDGRCDTGNMVGNVAECTLRAALAESNTQAGKQNILFTIPQNQAVNNVFLIEVTSALPTIVDPVAVEGVTQSGYQQGSPVLELKGPGFVLPISGLFITGGFSTIRGLSIYGFSRNGIRIEQSGHNLIESNIIGSNAQNIDMPGNGEDGIYIEGAPENTIGGGSAAKRNVISRNGLSLTGGCGVTAFLSADNVISSNYIGTDTTGLLPLPNTGSGVCLIDAPFNRVGGNKAADRNVISGNTMQGILVQESQSVSNQVLGNIVGLDKAGNNAIANRRNGILISLSDGGNWVGDGSLQGRNFIAGNGQAGIEVLAGLGLNSIDGNYVGTNLVGSAARPNETGVRITESPQNHIGVNGTNVISGNSGHGIVVAGDPSWSTQVQFNLIGTDPSGLLPLANGLDGVRLAGARDSRVVGNVIANNGAYGVAILGANESGQVNPNQANAANLVSANWIGATIDGSALGNGIDGITVSNSGQNRLGPDNLIRSNGSAGITVKQQPTETHGQGNVITANEIFSNIALGIDLGEDFITPNDALDGDVGANALHNYPLISNVVGPPLNLFEATLNTEPNQSVVIEIFSNQFADPAGHGEGEVFEGALTVASNPFGDVVFTGGFAQGQSGDCLSLTARNETTGDTSEFSSCIPIPPPPPPPGQNVDFGDAPENRGYPTRLARNGARHLVQLGISLGSLIDGDPDGQPNANASGDNADGSNDEGGVVFVGRVETFATTNLLEISVSAMGFIDAWIDFNNNGNWGDAGDQIFDSEPLVPGVNVLTFAVPPTATAGTTFARFRFSTSGGLHPFGPALNGEVEDYQVDIIGPLIFSDGFE